MKLLFIIVRLCRNIPILSYDIHRGDHDKLPSWKTEQVHRRYRQCCRSWSDRIGIILWDPDRYPGPADPEPDPYPFWPWDGLKVRIRIWNPVRDKQPGSHFLVLRNHFLGLKYLNSWMRIRDPGWKKIRSGIRDKHPRIRDTVKNVPVWYRYHPRGY